MTRHSFNSFPGQTYIFFFERLFLILQYQVSFQVRQSRPEVVKIEPILVPTSASNVLPDLIIWLVDFLLGRNLTNFVDFDGSLR